MLINYRLWYGMAGFGGIEEPMKEKDGLRSWTSNSRLRWGKKKPYGEHKEKANMNDWDQKDMILFLLFNYCTQCWQRLGEVSTSEWVWFPIIFKKIFLISTQSINFSYPAITLVSHIS